MGLARGCRYRRGGATKWGCRAKMRARGVTTGVAMGSASVVNAAASAVSPNAQVTESTVIPALPTAW